MLKLFFSVCAAALAFCLMAPQSVVAQGPIFGFTNKKNIPAVNKSGCPSFDKLRNQAIKKKLPLVIYVTGSKWCSKCYVCTNAHIKKPGFQAAAGKKLIFWKEDTVQKPSGRPENIKIRMVPEDAGKVVGCIDNQKAPYVIFGPPAVLILDPYSGELINSMPGKSEIDKHKKPLENVIAEIWKGYVEKKRTENKKKKQ